MGEGGGVALDVGEDGAAFVVGLLFTAVGAGIFAVWALYFNLVRLLLFFWRKSMVTGQVLEVYHCRDSAKLTPWKELLVVYTPVGANYSLQCKLRVDEGQEVHVHDQINLAFNTLGPLHYSTRHPFDQPAGNRRAISVALCFLWCCSFVVAALVFAISGQYAYSYCIPIVAVLAAAAVVVVFIVTMADKKIPASQAAFRGSEPETSAVAEKQRKHEAEQVEIELSEVEAPAKAVPEPQWEAGPPADTEVKEFDVSFPDDGALEEPQFDAGVLEDTEALEEPSVELDMHAEGLELGLLDAEEMEVMPVMELDMEAADFEALDELDD